MNNILMKADTNSNPSVNDVDSSDIQHFITELTRNFDGKCKVNAREVDECNNAIVKSPTTNGCPNHESFTALVPEMENLHLPRGKKSNDLKYLAGYIKAVISLTETAVIQLASGSRLLDLGTMIFANKNNTGQAQSTKNYQEIGYISDIFGTVHEPMYCVQLNNEISCTLLNIDSRVFYLPDHSTTRYVSVIYNNDNQYSVVQNQII